MPRRMNAFQRRKRVAIATSTLSALCCRLGLPQLVSPLFRHSAGRRGSARSSTEQRGSARSSGNARVSPLFN